VGWDSLVGIAVHYNAGIESDWGGRGARFYAFVETGPWAHPPYCTTGTSSVSL